MGSHKKAGGSRRGQEVLPEVGRGILTRVNADGLRASFAVKPIGALIHDPSEIEGTMSVLGSGADGGLIVLPDAFTDVYREQIIALAARYRVPTIYGYRYFTAAGGLISYGVNSADIYRRAAAYVDRILKGEKPADLPVQRPTTFELAINLKTAKALGLNVPANLLALADEVIE